MELPEFQKTAADFHALMQALHAQSDPEHCQSLPRFVELRAMPEWTLDQQIFARMDFSDAATSRLLCLGHFYDHLAKYDVLSYYRDDGEIQSKAQRKELYERFIKKWPGVSTYRKVREFITRGILLLTNLPYHITDVNTPSAASTSPDTERSADDGCPVLCRTLCPEIRSTALYMHTIHPYDPIMTDILCDCAQTACVRLFARHCGTTAFRNLRILRQRVPREKCHPACERLYRYPIWSSIVQINLLRQRIADLLFGETFTSTCAPT
jgi:hypothetical protein